MTVVGIGSAARRQRSHRPPPPRPQRPALHAT